MFSDDSNSINCGTVNDNVAENDGQSNTDSYRQQYCEYNIHIHCTLHFIEGGKTSKEFSRLGRGERPSASRVTR